MTVGNIARSNLHERKLLTRRGSNPHPPGHQSEAHTTEPLTPATVVLRCSCQALDKNRVIV